MCLHQGEYDDDEEWDARWLDRHSVGCFYCGVMFDEREGAIGPNGEGSVCQSCIDKGKPHCL